MAEKLIKRTERALEETWKLEDIYESAAAWEADYQAAQKLIEGVKAFEGKLSDIESLRQALNMASDAERIVGSLYTYAKMRLDEDNAVSAAQALLSRAQAIASECGAAASFVAPELLALPQTYLESAAADESLTDFSMMIGEIIRSKKHTLSAAEEKLLAMAGEVLSAPSDVFHMLNSADIKFPMIKDENGEDVRLTQSNYIPLVMSRSRDVRKAAFDALYTTYASFSATIPALYAASVKKDVFLAKAGKYENALHASLYQDNIPVSVYESLIESVHAQLKPLQRFLSINARLNGIEQMHFYDLYLTPKLGFDINLPFDEAYDLVVDCLHALGTEYQDVLRRAKNERWIDPYENEGKSSGAYSWGTYDSHPYVLINYKPDLDHLQTIAHEMGHSLHTWYSMSQPYPKADYSLFVAEVASTVNEVLVLMELMDRHPEKEAQAYLLYNLLDSFRGTVFRQTMFAEFEKISHEMVEAGEALTVESLNEAYANLNKQYYANLEYDELIAYEWMRIPHFYRTFYVYKYATGFSAAMAIARMIRTEGESAVKRYKRFLSAGCSLYPIDALKLAGIDMSKPEAVQSALNEFDALLARYEEAVQ